MTKRQDLCLQRRSRPEQSDQRQPNQAANISHQPRASPDSTSLASRIEFPTMTAPSNHHRRRATATPNRNAINSDPRGASRAILLKMLNGMPGFRPASIASLTRLAVPLTASEISAMPDFGSGAGSKPS